MTRGPSRLLHSFPPAQLSSSQWLRGVGEGPQTLGGGGAYRRVLGRHSPGVVLVDSGSLTLQDYGVACGGQDNRVYAGTAVGGSCNQVVFSEAIGGIFVNVQGGVAISGGYNDVFGSIAIGGNFNTPNGAIVIGGYQHRPSGGVIIGGSDHTTTNGSYSVLIGGKENAADHDWVAGSLWEDQ